MDNELKRQIEDFVKLYYHSIDKRRHQMNRLYLDNGLLIWNGNKALGKDNIQKYFIELPSSKHTIETMYAEAFGDEAGQLGFVIHTGGVFKFTDQPMKPFRQILIIKAQDGKWKIDNDCHRSQHATQDNK